MGEWSEYFEDFPEENPANYVNESFNPQLASKIRRQEAEHTAYVRNANAEAHALIAQAKIDAKARSLLVKEVCPQCRLEQLNTYKISEVSYLCECQSCNISGKGTTHKMALESVTEAMWKQGNHYYY